MIRLIILNRLGTTEKELGVSMDYLRHILVEANYLVDQAAGLQRDEFLANETLRRAFVRSLEIVGEAAKKVPEHFRRQYSMVEWRAMDPRADGQPPYQDGSARRARATVMVSASW